MTKFTQDYVVMVLSTDWFLDSWQWIGLDAEEHVRRQVQAGCRQIVSRMMGSTSVYYNISFADHRIQETVRLLRELLTKNKVGETFSARVEELIDGPTASYEDSSSAWSLAQLTGHIATKTLSAVECWLSPEITRTVSDRWRASEVTLPDFKAAQMNSNSQWDIYIRNLTPDLPATLPVFVTVSVITPLRFFLFWQSMKAELDDDQRAELIRWYKEAHKNLNTHPLRCPSWME